MTTNSEEDMGEGESSFIVKLPTVMTTLEISVWGSHKAKTTLAI